MQIRNYQPGDELAQAEIYNIAAGALPAFKPATAQEIERRYRTTDPDPATKSYAVDAGRIVGYAVYNPNGRISYPWCLPGAEGAQTPLLEAVLSGVRQRGCSKAWVAYRSDWTVLLSFLKQHGFVQVHQMVNYVAGRDRLPRMPIPAGQMISRLDRAELAQVQTLGRGIFPDDDPGTLERFYWENPYFDAHALYALKEAGSGRLLGAAVIVINPKYADPTKLDASMPCFRLGAMGTEAQRHKRVNGLFSCVFESDQAGEILLMEGARRLEHASLTHAAAQAPSDQPALCSFYDRFFERQGSFPILARRLD